MGFNNPRVKDAALQFLLRSIPLIPANETLLLLRSLQPESDIEKQVNEALESLQKSAALVERLEGDLKQRMETVQKLQEEHKKFSELSQISKDQAAALSDLVGSTLSASARRERVFALVINLFAGLIVFILGVIFAVPLTRIFGQLFQ
jgi:SpoVK/Ycf46/Vps4 family AAA+-type ATPase